MSAREQIRSAAISTLVVLPVIIVFFTLKMTNELLVLLFIAMLAQQPDVKIGVKGSMALIIGNTAGGVAAIVFYNLLIAVPEYVFLILLTILFSLFFGEKIFSVRINCCFSKLFNNVLIHFEQCCRSLIKNA